MSGKNKDRPELRGMMGFVRNGDTVIVESISSFARNTRDLLELVEQLTAKQVELMSKKEAVDTTILTGEFILTVFGAVAELEREHILQHQREDIAVAKATSIYKSQKSIKRPEFDGVIWQWRARQITAVEAMKWLDMKPSAF